MKEHSIAISASLLFHIIIVVLFLRVPFDQYLRPKLMVLDFSLEKGRGADSAEIVNRKSGIVNREAKIEDRELQQKGRVTGQRNAITEQEDNTQKRSATEPLLMKQDNMNTVASDPAGQVVIHGDTSRAGMKVDTVTETGIYPGKSSQNIAVSSGKGKVLNYEKDGADESDFIFIRDTILKRIKDKYPDRARRMGWEGKVLLSFDLFENGSIRNVKIVSSSGFRTLDDSAREIIEKTTFTQKIPYSRAVQLPVEYRLQ